MPSDAISAEESFRNSCHYFLEALRVLGLPPEQQCEEVGDYNVAWELKNDVLAGRYLLGLGFLSTSQEAQMLRVLEAVEAVEVNRLPAGAGRERNLKAMVDLSWEPVRFTAAEVFVALESLAADNAAYFGRGSAT
jgi:hypothetical protein